MFKNLIFDWSGTIVDDLGPVVDATTYVLESHGLEGYDREGFRKNFQLPYGPWWAEKLPAVALEEVERLFRVGFKASSASVPVLDYAREALEACRQAGVRMFVLSSMDEEAFFKQAREHGLEAYFEDFFIGVLDKREVIDELLSKHDLVKEETAFVGDMVHDVETAHHAGIASIAVMTGYNHPEVLVTARPQIMLEDLRYLERLVHPVCRTSHQCIKVRGLKVETHIGVPDEERAEPQTLLIHLEMVVGADFGKMADDVTQTVDYHAVSLAIEALAMKSPRKLIETLAADIADLVLTEFCVENVRVEIEKRILTQTEWVGCVLEKSRSNFY